MTTPDKDKVTSSTPTDAKVAADEAATAAADNAREAEVVADAEVIEANEAGELDSELERAAAEAVAGAIEESEQVAAAKAEAADWQDKYVRLHAEWDTYRRRMTEQREAEKVRATEKLMESLLPVLDDFVRTVDYAETNGETGLLGGVKAVQAKLTDTLAKGGLEVINPEGEAFDVLACQAVGTVDDPSVPDETVAQVYQLGYRMGEKVLRPAMVTITTGGPKREKPEEE
ncbi:nucleotide exchange factor GrpE [Adlercreutzia sp. R21]|uniref:nucleotide exchange factor GrpE n=1 Tax=Adlercreutzia wanghongyangiae TaxID=3111451 RepID=UPI002DBB3201|nr:nucleotide exchange factor GrpE [Adlercreutzia sp. R21]MEC4185306.1 nucleotide exchange factor GrpE [Adlercreutzia sp. R21]